MQLFQNYGSSDITVTIDLLLPMMGGPKRCAVFQHTISLKPFEIKFWGFLPKCCYEFLAT